MHIFHFVSHFKIHYTLPLLALAMLPLANLAASPITFNFNGALSNGGSVSGVFTEDPTSGAVSSFSFNLSQAGMPNPVSPGNYLLNNSDAYVTAVFSTGDFQIEQNPVDPFLTVLNLDFNALPGALAFSSLLQYPDSIGSSVDFLGLFSSGSASLDTPEPATPLLLFTGIALLIAARFLRSRLRQCDDGNFDARKSEIPEALRR